MVPLCCKRRRCHDLGRANLGEMSLDVIALPGGVMPAELRYAPLKSALAGEAAIHTKDLEV